MRKQLTTKAISSQDTDDAPLPSVLCYHAIIHREYDALTSCFDVWKTKCHEFAVAQHEEDDQVPRTHCHILIGSPTIQRDRFNEILKEKIPDLEGRKDFMILVKTVKSKGKPSVPYDVDELLKYLAKGDKTRLKCVENISPARVETAVDNWVETDKSDSSTDSYMDRVIDSIVDDFSKEWPKHYVREPDDIDDLRRICKYNLDLLLTNVRSKSFGILYRAKSIIPPPTLYKRVAGSAFLRLCDKAGLLGEGSSLIQNLWY